MSEEEQAGMRMRVAVPTRTVVFGLPLLAQVWGHQPATAGVGTHWRGSACFCRKATAAGALQATYLWMNCTNLLMKGARWREDFR